MILTKQQVGEWDPLGAGTMIPKYEFILINDGEEKRLSDDEFFFLREAIDAYESAEEWEGIPEDFTYTDRPPTQV